MTSPLVGEQSIENTKGLFYHAHILCHCYYPCYCAALRVDETVEVDEIAYGLGSAGIPARIADEVDENR